MSPSPPLPFAPRRRQPLSLWNPWDYLVMLYWVFYFPQALEWYVETFGSLPAMKDGWQAVKQDVVQRDLTIQGIFLTIITSFGLALLLSYCGVDINFASVAFGVAFGVAGGVAFGVAFGVARLRPDAFLLSLLPFLIRYRPNRRFVLQRISPIPTPGLRRRLIHQLQTNWSDGIHTCEGLLRYSLQFVPVLTALQQAFAQLSPDFLLSRIATWCSLPLADWQAVLFQSASLRAQLHQTFWENFFLIPRRWRPNVEVNLDYGTPARAACAAFWHMHAEELYHAAEAFSKVRDLAYGEELYTNALALETAMACQSMEDISSWQLVSQLDEPLLRPKVYEALAQLAQVAQELALVQQSRSSRQRNSALNRASGALNDLQHQLHDCPTPERPLIERIIQRWLRIVLDTASAVGTLDVREPVISPYIVGAPVPAERFARRDDIFDQLQAMWGKPGQCDSLVIYGHRRTGKSSIVRNLVHFCTFPTHASLAVLNLQSIDWSQGLHDLCYAIAFELWKPTPERLQEPLPNTFQEHPLAALRRLLAQLDRLQGKRRMMLILDEYELLDSHLPADSAEDFITTLRGFTQQYPWLVIALVGLHTLEERSASFYEAIYAWRPIKVGLMDADGGADVLQVEDDDFPLEYSLEAIRHAYDLTGGQPFLTQLLGDSLVQRFNRRLHQDLTPPSPTFSVDDVDAVVVASQFYQNGDVYFRGIWSQAGESPAGQHDLMRALAPHVAGLESNVLQQASQLDREAFAEALEALIRHDVLSCHEGLCEYRVELMRRWVQRQGSG